MTPLARGSAALLIGAVSACLLSGFQISQYPFKRTQFPNNQPHRMVYRDMTVDEIKPIMKKMAAELGVKCSYCHNLEDYASEEKPEKDFARKKILMQNWLNEKYRPATAPWKYTCWECHRGVIRPVTEGPAAANSSKPKQR